MTKKILFPVDVPCKSSWYPSLQELLEYIKNIDTEIYFVYVVPEFGISMVSQYFTDDAEETLITEASKELHKFIDENIPPNVISHTMIVQGKIYNKIIETAKNIKPDLIMMSAHKMEFRDYLLGSNASRVVRHAECSVMIVREAN